MTLKTCLGSAALMLSLLVLAPNAAVAGRERERDRFDCSLMRRLQCSAEARAELLALYRLPTAESRLAAGSEMYRVFIFNGWMNHHVVITVERSPGSSPTITLQAPPRPGRPGAELRPIPPVSVPISIDNWYLVQRRAGYFDRVLVPEPQEPGTISICGGHGPLYFVESTEPGPPLDRRLRRSGLGHCSEGLADQFAVEAALLAAEAIPACAALDEEAFFWTAELLRACAILAGDRLAAAEVYNLMRPLLDDGRERPSADVIEALFGAAEVAGPGAGEGLDADQAWLRALESEERTRFVVESVDARDTDHVVVDGLIRRRGARVSEDAAGDRVEEAPVQMIWGRISLELSLEHLTIGAFEAAPDRCNSRDHSRRAADC